MNKKDVSLIVEAFRLYPLNPNRIDEIVGSFHGHNVILKHENRLDGLIDEMYIDYVGYGELSKRLFITQDVFKDSCLIEYVVSFRVNQESYGPEFETNYKKDADDLCENILLWLLSKRRNKDSIALIINQMPELSNLILSGGL